VDGAAKGDHGEPRARRLRVLPRALAGGGEEAVAERRGAGREGLLGVEPGVEGGEETGARGERREDLERQGRGAQEEQRAALGAQAGPPPSASRRCM
jgi:hypothetical protein